MIYGTEEDGSAYIRLTKAEHEEFKNGVDVGKPVACAHGVADISLTMKFREGERRFPVDIYGARRPLDAIGNND
jgi:hypothetical protein